MMTRNPNPPLWAGSLGSQILGTITPHARIVEIAIDDILVPEDMRPLDAETVARIVESIGEIGLQPQGVISIAWAPVGSAHRAILVVGRHRLEAFRRLGYSTVPAAVFDGDAREAEQWRLAENLARAELSALERATQIARLMQLRAEKPAHDAQVSGGRGNRGGISDAARELGVDRRTVQRAQRVAGLAPEAKAAAVRLGLADNQLVLLTAAGAGGAFEQVASLEHYAARHQPPTPAQQARRKEKANATWQTITDWSDCAAEFLLDELAEDGCRKLLEMIDKIGPELGPMFTMDKLRAKLASRNTH